MACFDLATLKQFTGTDRYYRISKRPPGGQYWIGANTQHESILLEICSFSSICYQAIGSINQTSGIQNLDQDRYFNERSAYPPLDEQIVIANFLDNETAKIDRLVTEQEKLIELLKEKRRTAISIAVTKGLDPNIKMKYSGVEWLGEVPDHWSVVPLKYFVHMK
jgi:restriction endonuclease S subunit